MSPGKASLTEVQKVRVARSLGLEALTTRLLNVLVCLPSKAICYTINFFLGGGGDSKATHVIYVRL